MANKKSRLSSKATNANDDIQLDHDGADTEPTPMEHTRKRAAAPVKVVASTKVAKKPRATKKLAVATNDKGEPELNNIDGDDETKPVANADETQAATNRPRATRTRTAAAAVAAVATTRSTTATAAFKTTIATIKEDEQQQLDQAVAEDDVPGEPSKPKATKKRVSAAIVQSITTRDELPKLWDANEAKTNHGLYNFKIASWNVAGLRALLRNAPYALSELLSKYELDVLCLQEIKLQESHLEDPQLIQFRHQLSDLGYHIYYSCSTERKGYSGTAVLVRRGSNYNNSMEGNNNTDQPEEPTKKKAKKQTNLKSFFGAKVAEAAASADPTTSTEDLPKVILPDHVEILFASAKVSYGIGHAQHDGEGRVIVLDFPLFSLCNVYTPNSGQDLKRLSYRVDEWDKDFLSFIQRHSKDRQLPILWLGDLNIAHRALDVYNDGAKHLVKQAGVTPQERASFTQQLTDSGFVDVFRHLHPTAQGHYTYWSTRAGNRDANKGLRLDYFVCDPVMLEEDKSKVLVRDSYMLPEVKGSDHCPIVLELEIKASDQQQK